MIGFFKKKPKTTQIEIKKNISDLKTQKKSIKKPQNKDLKTLERNIEKQNKDLIKQLKKQASSKTAQQVIKYNKMYEDGICEIHTGYYSKSIKFSDINYQLARREDQIDIFSKYCQILNYFDSSVNVQISIISKHIDEEEFKRIMFLNTDTEDDLNEYRQEINEMLDEKALQGQNTIVREKYLTFATASPTYESAVSILSRIETDVITNLKALGVEVQTLAGQERLEIIHSLLNPQEQFNFDYSYLVESSLTTKDFITPSSFNFTNKNMYEFGEKIGQTLFLKDLPPDMADDLIASLSDLPINMNINIHINSVEQDKALAMVKQKIAFMEQQKIDEKLKLVKTGIFDDEMLPHELRYSHAEAVELLDDLQNKNQRMFKATILINTYSEDIDELNKNIYQIMATSRKKNCKISFLDYLQEEGLSSILPLGKNHVDIQRTLTTASTAIFIPFTTQELFQDKGLYYGLNALSRNLIFLNRKSLKNSNGFILGTPGSGKSFAAKREIANVLLCTDDDVLVIDPEREYSPMGKAFGGEIVHISAGSTNHINPLDMNMNYADDDDPLTLKSEFILSICNLITGNNIDTGEKSIIDRVCTFTYQPYLLGKTKTMPTLQDFYETLVKQPEPQAKTIALSLELYIKGNLSVFAQPTNVNINNRFVVFDIRDLGKNLKTLGMLVVLDQIWNRITQNRSKGKRTWIYIDEIYLLFQNEYSANYLFELYKRARKWGAIPTGITQNVEDLLLSDTARRMLSNSEFIMMLNQATSDRVILAELLNISSQQLNYVTASSAGQGLLFAGNAILPFVDKFPTNTKLYRMMTTKPEEIAEMMEEEKEIEIENIDIEKELILV